MALLYSIFPLFLLKIFWSQHFWAVLDCWFSMSAFIILHLTAEAINLYQIPKCYRESFYFLHSLPKKKKDNKRKVFHSICFKRIIFITYRISLIFLFGKNTFQSKTKFQTFLNIHFFRKIIYGNSIYFLALVL